MFPDSVMQVYQKFYAQREVLKGGPALTIDADVIGMAEFPAGKALIELEAMVGYLLGKNNISKMTFPDKLRIVNDAYGTQPYWRELLLDYFEMTIDVHEMEVQKDYEENYRKMKVIMGQANEQDEKREVVIDQVAEKIKKAGFRVNAKELVRNYAKMIKKDAKKAWEVLITNPAYFSPIKTQDETGKLVLTPAQAVDENAKLGRFLKHLKQ